MGFTGLTIRGDFTKFVNQFGKPIRVQFFTGSIPSGGYDDTVVITKTGTDLWTSGMIFPISNPRYGSAESMLMEQGKLQSDDMQLYLPGDITISGQYIKIGFGSPVDEVRYVIDPGVEYYNAVTYNNAITKVYTRFLNGGSFIGEQ